MQDELTFLITLQGFDAVIDELNEKAAEIDRPIGEKNRSIESLKTGIKTAKDAMVSFQVKKKELELEADAQEKLVKKHQGELNSLKSNDAYKAMLGEIDAAKKSQFKIEDQILQVMESMEKADLQAKEAEKKMKSDESVIRGEIQQLEKQKGEFLAQAEAKKTERQAYAQTVPGPLRDQYEAIRGKRSGVAIVPVNGSSCGGCSMSLTASKIIEVKKAKSMVLCESCMRILYLPPTPDASSNQDASKPQTVPAS